MSYVLEMLGRGLLAHLWGAFPGNLETDETSSLEELSAQSRQRPDDAAAAARFGAALLKADQAVAARAVFAKSLKQNPRHLPSLLGLACALDELGRLDDVVDLLRQAQKEDPTSPAILFCLGYCRERDGAADEATVFYRDALTLCPGLRNAHERLAAIHLKANRLPEAIESYQRLCEFEPQTTELHLTLANLLLQNGQYGAAIDRYQHALALEPDNWAVNDDVVSTYEKAGLYREAIEHMHGVVAREPGFADSHARLGDLYAAVGNDRAAMEHYMRAIEIHPDYLEATVKIGTQHLRGSRYEDAARWFTQALEINDRLLVAYIGLGVAQTSAGRSQEGRATFDMALAIEPNSTLLFSEMARMQIKAAVARQADRYLSPDDDDIARSDGPEDLLERQIERHREAIERSPSQADLHYHLALLLRHQGDVDGAIAALHAALEINPSYVKAWIKLGMALFETGDDEGAVDALRRAVAIEPQYVDLHYQLGLAFAKRQQFDIAVEHFERAAVGNPHNVDFQANLALALQQLGLIDRATACWDAVRALDPQSAWLDQSARFRLQDRFGHTAGPLDGAFDTSPEAGDEA